jgi:hypothetical protein
MKKALSIVFILVFFLAQFGNILSYAYCKWRAEAKAVTCDCEKKLVSETKTSDHATQQLLKEKPADPYVKTTLNTFDRFSEQINSCFVNTVSPLAQGFESSVLHPPLIA